MTTNHNIIGKRNFIAQHTIMRDVSIGEKRAIIADNRCAAAGIGTSVHCYAFADQAIGPDDQCGRAAFVLTVLGCCTQNGVMKHFCAIA